MFSDLALEQQYDNMIKQINISPLKGDISNRENNGDCFIERVEQEDLWYEIYSQHPISWETPAVQQIVRYIEKHYNIQKK